MIMAIVSLASALLGSLIGPWVKALWVDPKVEAKQKMRDNFQVFMMMSLEGFFQRSSDDGKIREVCEQYRMAWLYASDSVIKTINSWLKSQRVIPPSKDSAEWATASMVLQMRKEVYGKTDLREEDFFLVSPASVPRPTGNV